MFGTYLSPAGFHNVPAKILAHFLNLLDLSHERDSMYLTRPKGL
jgi:hypothetical protein